jgi:hypothetical protein
MSQNGAMLPLLTCVFAAGLTILDSQAGSMHRFFKRQKHSRPQAVAIARAQRSIASLSASTVLAPTVTTPARAAVARPSSTHATVPAVEGIAPDSTSEKFKACSPPELSGGRRFVLNQSEAETTFTTWAHDCGLEVDQLSANLPALWHYCDNGVVAACTTLTKTVKSRLTSKGLEESHFPVRALETLEAAETKACEGGIISSCDFSTYYARILETTAGFTTEPTIQRVNAALQSLCEQSHFGACGEIGLRLASSGRVEGDPTMVAEGVQYLGKACSEGENSRCAQILHFEEEAGRDTVLQAARIGCRNGDVATCIYLFEHPVEAQDRAMAKHVLVRSCRSSVPGQIDQMGLRACTALGRTPGQPQLD